MICFNNNSKNYDFHIERKTKMNFCFIARGTENNIYFPIYIVITLLFYCHMQANIIVQSYISHTKYEFLSNLITISIPQRGLRRFMIFDVKVIKK